MVLGSSWVLRGGSLKFLARDLGASWMLLGGSWVLLGGLLGAPWELLGALWDLHGSSLGTFWELFGAPWVLLGAPWQPWTLLRASRGFLGSSWGLLVTSKVADKSNSQNKKVRKGGRMSCCRLYTSPSPRD